MIETKESKDKTSIDPFNVLKATIDTIADELAQMNTNPDDIDEVEVLLSITTKVSNTEQTFVMADSMEGKGEKETILRTIAKLAHGKGITSSDIIGAMNSFSSNSDRPYYPAYDDEYRPPQAVSKSTAELFKEAGVDKDEIKNNDDLKIRMEALFNKINPDISENLEEDKDSVE
jgi:hypothetical protein